MNDLATLAENLRSPRWRLNNLYWIVDEHGQRRLFRFNDIQQQLVDDLHGRDVILKARQVGITTCICLIALDEALFLDNWRSAIIAHVLPEAQKIFETKIKFPYDNLPDALKAARPKTTDRQDSIAFDNGSSVSVTSSARSGTLQRLHISEFGKICAQYPDKAREIITGSFPAAEKGHITIEGTAEGQEGRFYEIVQEARDRDVRGPKDWRFHFFPWWQDSGYVYDPKLVTETDTDKRYFQNLEHLDGIKLTPAQRAWYIVTEREQGGDMKREYPSTADEAFEQAIEGAYFELQLAHATKHGLIGRFPYDPRAEVNTFWDLGRNDDTSIWLHQWIDGRNRFIGFYENSGEHISHYGLWLKEWARQTDDKLRWGTHYWPHDGDRQDLFLEHGRMAEADKLGIRPRVVPRVSSKLESIEAARAVFGKCDFDEAACSEGIRHLRHYRKERDEKRDVWRDRPRHDTHSNAADAFQVFAMGWKEPIVMKTRKRERNAWAA